MSCSICATIPATASANTGRDVHFQAPITSLKAHGLGRSEDLWECPECGALFHWYDDTPQSGSGNNDEEVLTRFPDEQATTMRAFIHRGDHAVEAVAKLDRLESLPTTAQDLVSRHVLDRDHALALGLVPQMLDTIERGDHQWLSFVKTIALTLHPAAVRAELAQRPPTPALDEVRAACARALCSICKPIPVYPRVTTRRGNLPAPLDALVQLGASDHLDVWECPECRSMFSWQSDSGDEGALSRLLDHQAKMYRACIHHDGIVPESTQQMLFVSTRPPALKIVLWYGMRRDQALVRLLLPGILAQLARHESPTLHDLLCDFVREPSPAQLVLDAIEESPANAPLVESVSTHCRRTLTSLPES